MELSDQDEIRLHNQQYILKFLLRTAHLEDELAESMKATISQFLHTIRKDVTMIALANEGCIREADIYELQIKNLRQCIVDLEQCLKRTLTGSTILQ